MPKLTAHPSREELSAYSLGQLPEERAVAIDTHISQCEPCCETIVELSSEDTFAGLLQEAGRLPTDQTVENASVPSKSSANSEDVPAPLAEHARYEVVRLIGKGGMGDVYEARHRMMERTVALKVIKHELMQKPEAVDRFHREVKAAAQLAHPNVVTAYDAEQAGDVHFLVMEHVNGVDLSRNVKDRGALPLSEACDYVRQAAVGLQYAHERGMVHRDIKPHNLMVTVDGTVKILDFGLASLAREGIADADTLEARGDLTAVGAIMGTPDFISPEQANDARQADIRSDIYSLGATLYFLLSGRPPFAEGSVTHKLKSHAQAEPEPLESLRDDVPPELVAIVTKMTAKDPEERYLTPSQVAEALESFLRDWRQEQEQPLGPKSSSGGDMSGTGGQKPGTGDMSPEWLPVAAKWLFYVMWIPVGLLVWETVFFDASSDASDVRVIIYIVAAILLSTVAGALGAAQRLNSEIDQTTRGDRRSFGMKGGDAWLVAALLIGAIYAAVYFMQPNHGIVRVEVSDPSLQVSINEQNITTLDGDGKTLTIRPSEQTLVVRNEDANFRFETDRFQIQRGDEINFKVDLRNGEIVVRKDYQTFARANMLVGSWHGKIDADEEVRLTLNANGTFEMVRLDPATPQRIQNRTTGKYLVNFSAFPAQFIFDGTIIYPKIDPPSEPPNTSNDLEGASRTMKGSERERVVKRKFAAMVDLADANTLYISDLHASPRRRMFGEEELAMHRQGIPPPREGDSQSQRKQPDLTDANTNVQESLPNGKSSTVAVDSQSSQPKKNEKAKPFRYDLSLVPSNAQLVCGARPGNILRDPRLAKLRESAPPLAGYTGLFVNENAAKVLVIWLPKPSRTSNPRVVIVTVDKGDAMEQVERAVGILERKPDEAVSEYERTRYVSRRGRHLVRRIDRKTVILGTREDFNAYQAAMNQSAPNGFREVAKTMQDCEFFVIANSQELSLFGPQQSSEYDDNDLLQMLRFLFGSSQFITASVSLAETPQFQLTARARTHELHSELAKVVTSLRDKMAGIVEAMTALPDGADASQFWVFKNRESAAAANASLSASRVTKPTGQDTHLIVPLDPAMSTVLRTINDWFDANKVQREFAEGNLKLISRGFLKFYAEHGYFPSVSTNIPGAAFPVSWRVAILPHVGYEKLYDQYNLDEPWDSEHNKAFLTQMPEIYRHPGSWRKSNETNVVSFVGETATGTGDQPVRLDVEFRDDPALTVLVAESASSIPWTKPDDLRFAADEPLPSIGGLRTEGWYAVFADGSLKFVPANTSIDVIAALLTRNGRESVQFEDNKFSLMNLGGQPRMSKPGDSTPNVSPKPKE